MSSRRTALLLCLLPSLSGCTIEQPSPPEALRCEYLTQPLAVDDRTPRFSWQLRDPNRGARQTAYELHVATSPASAKSDHPEIWSTGRVASADTALVSYSGPPLAAGTGYFWSVRYWDADGHPSEWSEPASFRVGLLQSNDWGGALWIGDPTPPPPIVPPKPAADGKSKGTPLQGLEALPAPMLRKEFAVSGGIRHATLYISALGLYEARINGQRVGDHDLAPEWTDYTTRVQYQAYDVTPMLQSGANAMGVTLADGWYAGRLGMAQQFSEHKWPRAVYGRQPRLIAQLVIETADGATHRLVTDGSWRSTLDGPIRSADLLDGEVHDTRHEIPGWDRPGFTEPASTAWSSVLVDASPKPQIVAQPNEPIRVLQEINPVALTQPSPGKWVFDLGQNIAGRCRLVLHGAAGASITLRHAEAINDDGTIYTANLRGAPQTDRITLTGDPGGETFEPRFTYHGFRFVEISGDIRPPVLTDLRGIVVGSSSPAAGSFECSNAQLNRLWLNVLWTQHANMMSVPTDCPQRDERLGWTGDIVAFDQTAMFNKDMGAFFSKWCQDLRDAQADDGRFPDIAPHPFGRNRQFTGVPAWGDVGVLVPWHAYINYADRRLLERQFDAARRWVDWIHTTNPDLVWRKGRHNDYNDWLNGDTLINEGWPRKGASVPNEILATAFFARSTQRVAQMAEVLGRTDDAARYRALHERIRAEFARLFIGADGRMPGDTQSGYALALAFDLAPRELRPALLEHLVAGIRRYDNHLSTGFHSSHLALLELSAAGHTDLCYQLVLDTRFPSWGYSITNGATTIWERWDGYVKGRGFQDPGMNSLNHWALGSVGEWMNRVILGINPDPNSPGFAHFTLAPRPGGGLTFARGYHHTIRGDIRSAWHTSPGRTIYSFTIPPNTTATIRLPARGEAAIREGDHALNRVAGLRVTSDSNGEVTLEAPSGTYEFSVSE